MKPTTPCLVLVGLTTTLSAQSMVDLIDVRNAVRPYASVFEIEAGAIGTMTGENDAQSRRCP